MPKHILVTGGAGFIGSHTSLELIENGYDVTVIDNFTNSSIESLRRVETLTGGHIAVVEGDLCDKALVERTFSKNHFDGVIHFAGLKAVGESIHKPLDYYRTNLDSTLTLCEVMQSAGIYTLIFSSSATVYGMSTELPLKEDNATGTGISNPYGWTKYMLEQILKDLSKTDPRWRITALRYFNPVGAHPSGRIGEDPRGTPNNLLPFVSQVAVGKRDKVMVFGNDYDTPDGTGVRDYIHVSDVASGHIAALEHTSAKTFEVYNLGTGRGESVMDVIKAFERATNKVIAYEVTNRRPGDVATNYADCSKAQRELNWLARKSLQDACNDAWQWQSQNPNGYSD